MPEAVGATERDRLMDGGQPEGLAGVNGEAGIVGPHELERVKMARRRKAGFGAGDVEPDDTRVAVPDRQFGDRP